MSTLNTSAGRQPKVRIESLVAKMLVRVVNEIRNRSVEPTPAMVDFSRGELERRVLAGPAPPQDRDLREIATRAIRVSKGPAGVGVVRKGPGGPGASQGAQFGGGSASFDGAAPGAMTPPLEASELQASASRGAVTAIPPPRELLQSTTRRQRNLLADAKWIEQAENDRVQAVAGRIQDRRDHQNRLLMQRAALDSQIEEHNDQKRADARERRRLQDEMTQRIADSNAATMRERQEAHNRSMAEKAFHERQQAEMNDRRERQRQDDLEEQTRHATLMRLELERQRQRDSDRKQQMRDDWNRTVEENTQRLEDKANAKLRNRALDQKFQQEYADQLDRLERQRAEARARKQARQDFNQKNLQAASAWFTEKTDNLDKQIEAEYAEQLRKDREEQAARKARNAQRLKDTHEVLDAQCAERRRQADEARYQDRLRAQRLTEEIAETDRAEQERRRAARAEALRLRDFLNTQLHMAHFKESKEPETSIARPLDAAKDMFSAPRVGRGKGAAGASATFGATDVSAADMTV